MRLFVGLTDQAVQILAYRALGAGAGRYMVGGSFHLGRGVGNGPPAYPASRMISKSL